MSRLDLWVWHSVNGGNAHTRSRPYESGSEEWKGRLAEADKTKLEKGIFEPWTQPIFERRDLSVWVSEGEAQRKRERRGETGAEKQTHLSDAQDENLKEQQTEMKNGPLGAGGTKLLLDSMWGAALCGLGAQSICPTRSRQTLVGLERRSGWRGGGGTEELTLPRRGHPRIRPQHRTKELQR